MLGGLLLYLFYSNLEGDTSTVARHVSLEILQIYDNEGVGPVESFYPRVVYNAEFTFTCQHYINSIILRVIFKVNALFSV